MKPLDFAVMALVGAGIMTAVAWYVQLVHYPTFRWIASSDFEKFHAHHVAGTGAVVVPGMLLELVGAVGLVVTSGSLLAKVGLGCCLVAFALTFGISARIHQKLSAAHSVADIEALIRTNLPRTLVWSAHLVVSVVVLLG
ncbi:MAG: hypothetical protein ACOYON_03245 [Fimbriimonas sp.]